MKKLIAAVVFLFGTIFCGSLLIVSGDGAKAPEVNYDGLNTYAVTSSTPKTPESEKPAEQVTGKLENPEISTPEEDNEPLVDEPNQVKNYYAEIPLDADVQAALFDACDKFDIDYALALGLIQTESRFDPYAMSYSGCYGLCQLNPAYFPSWLSPSENVTYGMEYLARQIRVYGSVEAGLCAYNAGHDTGNRFYSNAVLAAAAEWTDFFNN